MLPFCMITVIKGKQLLYFGGLGLYDPKFLLVWMECVSFTLLILCLVVECFSCVEYVLMSWGCLLVG